MLINVEMNQLEKKLRELKTLKEQDEQVETWLTNNNISPSEYKKLKDYITPKV